MQEFDDNEYLNESKIAIIGMNGRFPGAPNIAQFWQNLCDGLESITFFSDEELLAAGISLKTLNSPNYVKAKSILNDVDLFDASFFGYSAKEAAIMDPQQRIFLECAWAALEDAGYNANNFQNRFGIYAGAGKNTYLYYNLFAHPEMTNATNGFSTVIANDKDYLSTRVAYHLNLTGPALTVQTACSTSLVAIHLAYLSLLSGECDMALAGGVCIDVPQVTGYSYVEDSILSPDGHCQPFDAQAKGTIFGQGVGVVVLKRLVDALEDRDHIYAVIRGTAVNNDGHGKVGYTAPSIDGQANVIADALAMADVSPETISYIETHGTGTILGDPIEVAALNQVFQSYSTDKKSCAIGSVKSNVGHLNTAAGITGLIKTVLALKHKLIPPSLHFETPNPNINIEQTPFYVNTQLSKWQTEKLPRRAGVSSFGIGGTNAHVILEEISTIRESGQSRPWQLLMLSAKTDSALNSMMQNLAEFMKENPAIDLADIAYTLQLGRQTFAHRCLVVCSNHKDAIDALELSDPRHVFFSKQETSERPIIFTFPGQGTQYVNMGLELYEKERLFREQVNSCSDILQPHLGLDLSEMLYPQKEKVVEATEQLKQTAFAQPALFVVEYSLAKLLIAWGFSPHAMIGHSIGEYVAACLAGVISLPDALRLVAIRGRLMQQQPPGAMLAVSLSKEAVKPFLHEELSLAAVNSPNNCVVSGSVSAIDLLEDKLNQQNISFRRLHTSHAFHSHMMDPTLALFTEEIKRVRLTAPKIPYISNTTGTWITAGEATSPDYWANHIRQPVYFAEGIQTLLEKHKVFIEVGPGQTLSTLASAIDKEVRHLPTMRHPHHLQSDIAFILNTLGRLWLGGIHVNWQTFYTDEKRFRVPLPSYPFARQRHWVDPKTVQAPVSISQTTPELRSNVEEWFYVPSWERTVLPINQESHLAQNSCWLVFVDELGLGAQLKEQLERLGYEVIEVNVGDKFYSTTTNIYTIDPGDPNHYETLVKRLKQTNKVPQVIVHCWTILSASGVQDSPAHALNQLKDLSYYSLLFLMQAFDQEGLIDALSIDNELQIEVITNDLHSNALENKLRSEKALILSLCKIIPQEYRGIVCRSIDIATMAIGSHQQKLAINQLLAEIVSNSPDATVMYRGHQRWVQTFTNLQLSSETEQISPLRLNGVYMITGGLGRIGTLLAKYLAEHQQAKLVLLGRTALPSREEWSTWLDNDEENNITSQKIRNVQKIESLGGEVLLLSADVADEEQMQLAIRQAYERFGVIHGVIHAAGVTQGESVYRSIKETKRYESELQFQAKVKGLYVLDKVLQDKEIDFCLLFSSNAAVLGGLGLVAYSAANMFMDAFVKSVQNTYTIPWMSTNWDIWLPETQAERENNLYTSIDSFSLDSNEALTAFNRTICSGAVGQVIISKGDLISRSKRWLQRKQWSDISEGVEAEGIIAVTLRPDLENAYVAPRNEIERRLTQIWEDLLGVKPVGVFDNFFELGGHSLLATQLASKLRTVFNIELSFRTLFESPIIADLAVNVSMELAQLIDSETLAYLETLSHKEIKEKLDSADIMKST